MRLHLDSSISAGAANSAPAAQAGGTAPRNSSRAGDAAGNRDSSSISGASSALNEFSAQRSARIAQLTAAVQSGQYQVSSAVLSSAIVGHATA